MAGLTEEERKRRALAAFIGAADPDVQNWMRILTRGQATPADTARIVNNQLPWYDIVTAILSGARPSMQRDMTYHWPDVVNGVDLKTAQHPTRRAQNESQFGFSYTTGQRGR